MTNPATTKTLALLEQSPGLRVQQQKEWGFGATFLIDFVHFER